MLCNTNSLSWGREWSTHTFTLSPIVGLDVPWSYLHSLTDSVNYLRLSRVSNQQQLALHCIFTQVCQARRINNNTQCTWQGFSWGDWGSPPSGKNFVNPPIWHLSPFLDQGLSYPAEVRPRKFEKFRYIFVSNLTVRTFKLKSTLKRCISCLK